MVPKAISDPEAGFVTTLVVIEPPSISRSLASKCAGVDEVETTRSVLIVV